jgi:flagellar hook protein FlgE
MSFYTSLSGLRAAQTDLSVTSNNIANVGSVGFKRSRASFGDIMPPSSSQAGIGTRLKGIEQQFTQGNFETSSRELDTMINGNGFFVTKSPDGSEMLFTRDGALSISGDRHLTDSKGNYLQLFPVDADGNATGTDLASATQVQIPETSTGGARLSDLSIDSEGLVTRQLCGWLAAAPGPHCAGQFREPGGAPPKGQWPLDLDRRERRSDHRRVWHRRAGLDPDRRSRARQCRPHRGAGLADRCAAQFPGECEGDRNRQHADADHHELRS